MSACVIPPPPPDVGNEYIKFPDDSDTVACSDVFPVAEHRCAFACQRETPSSWASGTTAREGAAYSTSLGSTGASASSCGAESARVLLTEFLLQQHMELLRFLEDHRLLTSTKGEVGEQRSSWRSMALASPLQEAPPTCVSLVKQSFDPKGDEKPYANCVLKTSDHDDKQCDSGSPPLRAAIGNRSLSADLGAKISAVTRPTRGRHRRSTLPAENEGVLQRYLKSNTYEICMISIIVLNAAFIGVQLQNSIADIEQGETYSATDDKILCSVKMFFLAFFCLELALRLLADGLRFFTSENRYWNWFDFLIIISMAGEALLERMGGEQHSFFAGLGILRVCRVLRTIRVVRALKFCSKLRMLLSCIIDSFQSLMWAMVTMIFLLYITAVLLVDGCADFLRGNEIDWNDKGMARLHAYFGSLDSAMRSLFQAVAGGMEWGDMVDALAPLHPIYTIGFHLFISFSIFGMVNVISGLFLQGVMDSAQRDHEALIKDAMEDKETQLETIGAMLDEVDDDGDGKIFKSQLFDVMIDPRMIACLEAHNLEVDHLTVLAVLLDPCQTGTVDIGEFLDGYRKLSSGATTMDMSMLLFQVKWMMANLDRLNGNDGRGRHLRGVFRSSSEVSLRSGVSP